LRCHRREIRPESEAAARLAAIRIEAFQHIILSSVNETRI